MALTLFDGGVVEGTVLGLEKVTVVETATEEGSTTPTSKVVEKEVLNLLMEDDSIQAFPVLELESFGIAAASKTCSARQRSTHTSSSSFCSSLRACSVQGHDAEARPAAPA